MNARARAIIDRARKNCEPISFPPRDPVEDTASDALLRNAQRRAAEPVKRAADSLTDSERARRERESWDRWLTETLDRERNVILEAAGQAVAELIEQEAAKWRKDRDDLRSQISRLEVELAHARVDVARIDQQQHQLACDKAVDLPQWPKRGEIKSVN